MNKNIVLIGMSGCGKTTVGGLLSNLLKSVFYDSDAEIEVYAQRTVPEIFENEGEAHFRELESLVLAKLAEKRGCVIATGGGCVKNPLNIKRLGENGVIVYLKASPEKIMSNLQRDDSRPLLKTTSPSNSGDTHYEQKLAKIKGLYDERQVLYERSADVTIDVTNMEAKQTAMLILDLTGNSVNPSN